MGSTDPAHWGVAGADTATRALHCHNPAAQPISPNRSTSDASTTSEELHVPGPPEVAGVESCTHVRARNSR